MAMGTHLLDPQLLPWRPEAHKHQIGLLPPQIRFHHGPVVGVLIAMDEAL
ncbi:hypothetical protein FLM9_1572 [Candidatus Synechococcus spongiarum]|uniref:Uncharacterized protein n=1 Tax=Candidatus Synechococcus spongiarum TaxID=431041 RepID=A0A164Z6R7_9SYNE|nr:hypothetical protein FLM9_1572 [Candidatus Synechococcus spongiarum]